MTSMVAKRLVEDHDRGAVDDRLGDLRPALHPARELVGELVAEIAETELLEQRRSAAAAERAPARASPSRLLGPNATLSVTRIHGYSAVSWNTMMRSGPGPAMGRESMERVPASGAM